MSKKKLIFRLSLMEEDLKKQNQPSPGDWAKMLDGHEVQKRSDGTIAWAGYELKPVVDIFGRKAVEKVPQAFKLEPEWCEEIK